MRRFILCTALGLALVAPAAGRPDPSPTELSLPRAADLTRARTSRNAGNYEEAEAILRKALQASDLRKPERDQFETELNGVLTARRQVIELKAIERQIDQGQFDDASKRLITLLPAAVDDGVLKRIEMLLTRSESSFSTTLRRARVARNLGDYAGAEAILKEVLQTTDLKKPERDQFEGELNGILTARRQVIELKAIERQIDQGQFDEASKRLIALLPAAVDDGVLKRIEMLLARSKSSFPTALRRARVARNLGDYASAEAILREVLQTIDIKKPERDQFESELNGILTARRQLVELAAIEGQIDQGRLDDASKRLIALLPTATEDRVLERIRILLARSEPWWPPPFATLASWGSAAAPYVILMVLLIAVRQLLFKVCSGRESRWLLAELGDTTNRSAKTMIAHYFLYWSTLGSASITSGLLLMEASSLPLAPHITLEAEGGYDVAKELSSIELTVGGVSVASLARTFSALFSWLLPKPMEITGIAYIDDEKRICARLTASLPERNGNRYIFGFRRRIARVIAVSATASGDSEETVRRVAEEVTFKMLYALGKQDVDASERANDLRCGLDKLRAYLSATLPKGVSSLWTVLEEARRIFESVRKASPESLEVHIYEGIALDLLERHEDAAAHFDYVKQLTARSTDRDKVKLYQQAVYNGAVAHLRNLYQLHEIDEAIQRLNVLIGVNPNVEENPLFALALATKADAWANRIIHWRSIRPAGLPRHASDDAKLAAVAGEVGVHVITITDNLRTLLGRPLREDIWDVDTRRQVEWAIHNALGDFYLYAAVARAGIDFEKSGVFSGRSPSQQTREFEDALRKARTHLRTCEMLLPAGVETLSNIGTMFLISGNAADLPHARQYLQQAIALNAHYEYAYYRLAQSWEAEHWREKVVEILRSYPAPPQIPEFRKMFKHYFVEPKFQYTNDASAPVAATPAATPLSTSAATPVSTPAATSVSTPASKPKDNV